jgi:hypothetical protein
MEMNMETKKTWKKEAEQRKVRGVKGGEKGKCLIFNCII